MTSLDQLKHTFFDECSEGLQQTEQGLSDIRDGLGNDETVNAVFRAVHSVKGGAGIFGFEALVEFAHVFETTLDAVRRGDLATSTDVMDTLLAASDVLSDLVQMSRSGDPVPAGFGSECRVALQGLIAKDGGGGGEDESAAPADFDDIDFVPLRFDAFDAADEAGGPRVYRIAFRPKPELLKNGSDPLLLLRQLRELGELDLVAEVERLPDLANCSRISPISAGPARCAVPPPRAQVEEIFEFAASDCELEIIEESAPAPAEAAFESMPAVEMPAVEMPLSSSRPPPCRSLKCRFRSPVEAAPPIVPAARPAKRSGARRRRSCRQAAGPGYQTGGDHHPHRTRKDRPRRQHGRRTGDRAGDARPDRPRPAGSGERPAVADPRRSRASHPRTERRADVDARAGRRLRVPAHAAAGARSRRQGEQEGAPRACRRNHRGRSLDHRTAGRSADAYHPQLGRSRHRIAGRAAGRRQERGRRRAPLRRASRQPHRDRDRRRRRRRQFGSRAEEGARERPGRRRRDADRGRDQQPDHDAGLLHRGDDFRHFRPRRRHGRGAHQYPGDRRPHHAAFGARQGHDDPAPAAADARGDGRHGDQGRPRDLS